MRRVTSWFSGLLMIGLAGAALAAEPLPTDTRTVRPAERKAPAAVAPTTSPTPTLAATPRPLQMTLRRNMVALQPMSVCVTVPGSVKAVMDQDLATRDALKAAGVNGSFGLGRSKIQGYFMPAVNNCCSPTKSFSVQDQQAAGCSGSDTVNACMEKLVRACIHHHATALHIKEDMQKQHQSASAVNSASGQYAQKVQQLLSTLP